MRKILLASAGVMVMSAGTGYAACIPTPSCASLGYESSSSCEGGIKCPFGNAWNCTVINIFRLDLFDFIRQLENTNRRSRLYKRRRTWTGYDYKIYR